jgi:xanthine dehydrogenase YagS FAD-binding subunit
MHPFTLSTAKDLDAAAADHARESGVMFIAGGTDLMGLMKDHVVEPVHLLDINHLPGLDLTEPTPEGGLRIGALTRMSDVAIDTGVRQRAPMISEALLLSASTQLRNMASMGGNLMQRTRCAYFRDVDGAPCNKRSPGSGCASRHGINRNHAIFGWSDACVATHPSDVAVALSALDCTVRVHSPQGVRAVPIGDFHRLPGTTPDKDNILGRGDVIIGLEIPFRREARRSHYLKVRDRQSYEFALVSVAAGLDLDGRTIRSARLAMGGVAHKPWRLTAAEQALAGVGLDDPARLREAIARSFTDARPLEQNVFKVELAQRSVLRALQTVGDRA